MTLIVRPNSDRIRPVPFPTSFPRPKRRRPLMKRLRNALFWLALPVTVPVLVALAVIVAAVAALGLSAFIITMWLSVLWCGE